MNVISDTIKYIGVDDLDIDLFESQYANLTAALNGRQPDYLVAHHMEPDHAALIAWMLETYPGLQLVCSAQAVKMLYELRQHGQSALLC